MGGIGSGELIIIFVVILLLFGNKKLTELARGMGESTKEVKKIQKEFKEVTEEEPTKTEKEDV